MSWLHSEIRLLSGGVEIETALMTSSGQRLELWEWAPSESEPEQG